MTTEQSSAFSEGLHEAFYGEIYGEHAILLIEAIRAEPRERQALRLIADIERATATALVPLVIDEPQARADALRHAADAAEAIGSLPWSDLVDAIAAGVREALADYRQLRQIAPADAVDAVDQLIEHEVVLCEFARLENSGERDLSMSLLRRYLVACRPGSVPAN